jgi:hypothetical protein
MKVKQIFGSLLLSGILSVGIFGGTVSGRVTGIAVDPSDPSGSIYLITLVANGACLLAML